MCVLVFTNYTIGLRLKKHGGKQTSVILFLVANSHSVCQSNRDWCSHWIAVFGNWQRRGKSFGKCSVSFLFNHVFHICSSYANSFNM